MEDNKKNDMLYNAIIGWYDNALTGYHGLDDPLFITSVCETTGMTETEYNSLMFEKKLD